MKFIPTAIPDLFEIEPQVFGDHRGYFYESYNADAFVREGIHLEFKQDNESNSNARVLRGLHFQHPPKAQGKLVRVQRGSVLDVVVDLRKGSPTYGQHHKVVLSGQNKKMLWIPVGFAHGFLTLEDDTIFLYKCTDTYSPEHEGSIHWKDSELNIDWGITDPQLSEKDLTAPSFNNFNSPFEYEQ